jgi:O-antigen/teichoic acid export membrane protein
MLSGAAWTISMRFGVKGLGFLSTVILARLILPEEYAVVAMSMLVVGLIEAFVDVDADIALLRKDKVDRDFINSTWSLRILQGLFVAGCLIFAAPLASAYFQDDRVGPVLWVLAGCVAIASTRNIGLVLARKELQFTLDFKVQITIKIVQVLVTAAAAYILRDYRALVIGVATGYLTGWLLSYALHPYRPRWCSKNFSDIWGVTRWLMLTNIMVYIVRKTDEFAAGRIGSSHEFGLYNVGADLGKLPTAEIGPALLKVLLPVLSSIQNEAERIRSGVLKVMAVLNAVLIPTGFGVAAVAPALVLTILGPNWVEAAPIVGLFGIAGAIQSLSQPLATLLTLRGFTRVQSRVVWFEFISFALAAVILVPNFHLIGLICARMVGATVAFLLFATECHRRCGLSALASTATIWRPLLCATLMYFGVQETTALVESTVLDLIVGITSGALIYIFSMVTTWFLTGRPTGIESESMGFYSHWRSKKTGRNP